MTPFRKKTSRCWFITVPTKEGAYSRLSGGTRDYNTAVAMQDMVTALGRRGSRNWDIIDAIVERRVKIERVYDFYPERLDDLRAELKDEDLAPAIDAWDKDLDVRLKAGDLATETVKHYRRQANWLFPKDESGKRLAVRRSTILAKGYFKTKLEEVPGSSTNKRRHAAGWNSLLGYLVEAGKLEQNPLDNVTLPKNNKSTRPRIERFEDVVRFVEAFPAGPHRAAAAFQEGAGVEMQAMLATRRRDIVDEKNRVMWAHGQKNDSRDRQVIVDEWAFAIIMAYVKSEALHPDALLFPITEDTHRARWYETRDALIEKGVNIPANYKPHSCRNTYSVRNLKTGRDPVLISSNLGHADTSELLRLYGKHRPAVTDLIRADQRGASGGK
jgi:integrase